MVHGPQADLYDALAVPLWESLRAAIDQALRPYRGRSGLAVDLGAGTGLSTVAIAAALPRCEVMAAEPSAAMRGCLLTRLVTSDLTGRVTVLPCGAAEVVDDVIEPVTVFSAVNMVGQLDPRTRQRLWSWLSTWLTADGVAMIGPIPETEATTSDPEEVTFATARVGRRTYTGASRTEVVDDQGGWWHLTWRVTAGDRQLEVRTAAFPWHRGAVRSVITAELEQAGLAVQHAPGEFLLATRAQPGDVAAL